MLYRVAANMTDSDQHDYAMCAANRLLQSMRIERHVLKVCADQHDCWSCASAPEPKILSASYRHEVSRRVLGQGPALVMCPDLWVVSKIGPTRSL